MEADDKGGVGMAYYDYNGTITIDEQAARRDIQKLNSVLPSLEAAKRTLERLNEEGGNTKGSTGQAIVEKSSELVKRLNDMIRAMQETRNCIEQTVRHYQKLDQEVKAAIQAAALTGK